jgi:VanZ family protein
MSMHTNTRTSRLNEKGPVVHHHGLTLATAGYAAIIAYATLFFAGPWQLPADEQLLAWKGWQGASRADLVQNVIGYLPLGALLALRLVSRGSATIAVIATVCCGFLLSLSLETIQVFVPGRQSSAMDLLMNTLGTTVGALVTVFAASRNAPSGTVARMRFEWFAPGLIGNLGIASILLWTASELSPFIPTIDVSTLRAGVSTAWQKLQQPSLFRFSGALTYACYLSALGAVWLASAKRDKVGVQTYCFFVLAVLLLKPFFVGRDLSLEALVGFSAALLMVALQIGLEPRRRTITGVLFLCIGFLVYEFAPAGGAYHPFNWIPFGGEIRNTLSGLMGITGFIWVFFSLAALFRMRCAPLRHSEVAWLGGGVVAGAVGVCEWLQQWVPGRYGDITTVAIAVIGWTAVWALPRKDGTPDEGNGRGGPGCSSRAQ